MIQARVTESYGVLKCTIRSNRPVLKGFVRIGKGGSAEPYSGDYVVTPAPFAEQTLATKNKLMANDVTVNAIPYYETSNISGITIYIGGK